MKQKIIQTQLIRGVVTLVAVFFSIAARAQTTVVKALLKDAQTQESEPYATVRVFTPSDKEKPIAVSVADGEGKVHQEVKGKGQYILQVSAIGKQTVEQPFTINDESQIDLGTILMKEDAQMLSNVEVVGTKPLVKMETDKMTYSVENDQDSRTQTVLDMLRKVPMVTVDGQDNITVNGSSSYQVYVNGKPNPMLSQYASIAFKQMPASMVKSIEVVTNPGARYDAEGTGGVLNIVMQSQDGQQQKMNGVSGQANLMAAPEGIGGGVSLTGQQGKWSYSARIFGNHMEMDGTEVHINREQMSELGSTFMNYYQKGRHIQSFGMAMLGAGVELDSMSNLNVNLSLMKNRNKDTGNPTTSWSGGIYGDGFSYSNRMQQKQGWQQLEASADYQRFFNKERTSWMSLIYTINYEPNSNDSWMLFDQDYTLTLALQSLQSIDHNHTS